MRSDIVGYTLAETALALLFTVFAGMLAQRTATVDVERSPQPPTSTVKTPPPSSAGANSKSPRLLSPNLPSCAQQGSSNDWLFSVVVHGKDAYEHLSRILTLDQLLKQYSAQLRDANLRGCRHTIKVFVGEDVSGLDYDYAIRHLSVWFYPKYMGPK